MTLARAAAVSGRIAFTLGFAAMGTVLLGTDAFAQTANGLGSMAGNAATDLIQFEKILALICYLGAAGTGVSAVLKFKEHGQNPNQVKLSDPIIRTAVAAGLVGLPMILSGGVATMFGGNTQRAVTSGTANQTGGFNIR